MVDRTVNWAQNLLEGQSDMPVTKPYATAPKVAATTAPIEAVSNGVPSSKVALAQALLKQRLKKRCRFTEPDKAKIFGAFLQGESVENIGAKFGVSGMTIRKLIDDAIVEGGCELPKKTRRRKP